MVPGFLEGVLSNLLLDPIGEEIAWHSIDYWDY